MPAASRGTMPIADVASDIAGRAALEEVAREMTAAEEEGRVIKRLLLDQIGTQHIARDRLAMDADELETLKSSIAERGQQAPIEVLRHSGGFGLISGLRRMEALRQLGETHVLALVRQPETAADTYRAMVEENEIRANLSFYERARIAAIAARQGVYADDRAAVAGLFAHAPAPKRSKIARFLTLYHALDPVLRFPAAIPEKLGLDLAQAMEADAVFAGRVRDALRKTPAQDAAGERAALERALRRRGEGAKTQAKSAPEEIAPGIRLAPGKGRAVLSGQGVTPEFLEALAAWAAARKTR